MADAIRAIRPEPYTGQQELVLDRLEATRQWIAHAVEQLQLTAADPREAPPWPTELAADTRIEARIEASRREDLPLLALRDRFALSITEERVLWLLIAYELCPAARQLVRGVATEETSDPTTDAIRRIVYGREVGAYVWRELGANGALRAHDFIERTDGAGDTADHRQTWKVSRRVLALVHGEVALDPALADIASLDDRWPRPRLDELQVAGDAAARIDAAFESDALVLVHGRAGSGRRSILTAIADARGFALLVIDGRTIAKERDVATQQLRRVARECRLLGRTPLVADLDALAATSDAIDRIDLVERELEGLVLATATRPIARRWKRAPLAIELPALSGAQRAKLWAAALPAHAAQDADLLATLYPLAPAFIHAAGRAVVEQCGTARMTAEDISSGLRVVLDDRLAGLATRLTVTQTWNDLVLPDDAMTSVAELMSRVRERRRVYEDWGFANKLGKGLGVTALFSGPPGTGKTMAAGLVARQLRAELYQVDLSKIVSKWIGETEKNLAALFDAAEAGHAMLLFDEADALFGKRTEVKTSNDRHANQEVNFLLQRLETFSGICILTTNHENAIDEAFRRRLSVHVRFPTPDEDERARLWRAMLPPGAPAAGDLGIDHLAATYAMSGGYIRNAVLRAAFLAADEDGAIDAARLARGAQLEYQSMGKVFAAKER